MNDIGTVDVDARLMRSVHGRVMSLWNGCICCDYAGDLRLSLLTLTGMAEEIDQIVVEASGIADPHGIAATFRVPELRGRARLDGIIALVDAEHARDPRLDAQLVRDQIAIADVVLLNKVDLVTAEARRALRTWIGDIAPTARVLETSNRSAPGPAPLALILGVNQSARPHPARRDHAQRDRFQTWTFQSDTPLDLHTTIQALKALPPGIFRAKGFLYLADAPRLRFLVQVVGSRVSSDILGPWGPDPPRTELVVIGTAGSATAEALRRHLAGIGRAVSLT